MCTVPFLVSAKKVYDIRQYREARFGNIDLNSIKLWVKQYVIELNVAIKDVE